MHPHPLSWIALNRDAIRERLEHSWARLSAARSTRRKKRVAFSMKIAANERKAPNSSLLLFQETQGRSQSARGVLLKGTASAVPETH